MANDENLRVRVAIVEQQLSRLVDDAAYIRANYATKDDVARLADRLDARMDLLATKAELTAAIADLQARLNHFVTKEEFRQLEIQLSHGATREQFQRLEIQLSHCASRAELQQLVQSTRNWVIGVGVGMCFSLAALQIALFELLRHGYQVFPCMT